MQYNDSRRPAYDFWFDLHRKNNKSFSYRQHIPKTKLYLKNNHKKCWQLIVFIIITRQKIVNRWWHVLLNYCHVLFIILTFLLNYCRLLLVWFNYTNSVEGCSISSKCVDLNLLSNLSFQSTCQINEQMSFLVATPRLVNRRLWKIQIIVTEL